MSDFPDLTVKVEVMPGSWVPGAIAQLVALSDRIGIAVEAKMNGVIVIANPGNDAKALAELWDRELCDTSRTLKMAVLPRNATNLDSPS